MFVDDDGELIAVVARVESQRDAHGDVEGQVEAERAMIGIETGAVPAERNVLTPPHPGGCCCTYRAVQIRE